MKRALTWVAALAMLVAAWVISGEAPDGEQRIDDPFPVTARVGEAVTSDNLGVTVHDVRLTDRLSTGGWSADGTWLVVSLDAWLVRREPASLKLGYLVVGERTFLASERVATYDVDASLSGSGLHERIAAAVPRHAAPRALSAAESARRRRGRVRRRSHRAAARHDDGTPRHLLDDSVTGRWWRRNALALVALVILVPTSVWAFDQIQGGLSRDAQRDLDPGRSAEVLDWTFDVPRLEPVDATEVRAPAGSIPVVVRVRVTPGQGQVSCSEPSVVDPATGRTWAVARDLRWTRDADDSSSCITGGDPSGSGAPFDLTTLVLLPGDAPKDLTVVFPGYPSHDEIATNLRFPVSR